MRAAATIALALAPLPCLAEGAVQTWDCHATSICATAAGQETACADTDPKAHVFEIAPLETDADGAGRYRISHNGQSFDGDGRSFIGPFDWDQEGATAFSLRADPRPDNQILFDLFIAPRDGSAPMQRILLDCEVTQ